MALETEISSVIVQSVASVVAILIIGWRIKESLCTQINKLTIELGTHIGITEPQKKELYDKINKIDFRLDKLILNNNLKV